MDKKKSHIPDTVIDSVVEKTPDVPVIKPRKRHTVLEFFRPWVTKSHHQKIGIFSIPILQIALLIGAIALLDHYVTRPEPMEVTEIRTEAATQAQLFFVPDALPDPFTATTIQVWLTAEDNAIVFAGFEFNFDKSKIKLTDEITTTDTLKTVVSKTTMANANKDGKVTINLGLSPGDRENAPTGDFMLASIKIAPVSSAVTDGGSITFNDAAVQIANQDKEMVPSTSVSIGEGGYVPEPTEPPVVEPTDYEPQPTTKPPTYKTPVPQKTGMPGGTTVRPSKPTSDGNTRPSWSQVRPTTRPGSTQPDQSQRDTEIRRNPQSLWQWLLNFLSRSRDRNFDVDNKGKVGMMDLFSYYQKWNDLCRPKQSDPATEVKRDVRNSFGEMNQGAQPTSRTRVQPTSGSRFNVQPTGTNFNKLPSPVKSTWTNTRPTQTKSVPTWRPPTQ